MATNKARAATSAAVRDELGRFPAGVSGNPAGRPLGRRNQITELTQDLEIAVRKNISAPRVKNIVERLITMAEQGDVKAARIILDKVLPNATAGASEDSGQPPNLTIRIENTTRDSTERPTVRVIEHDATTEGTS